jgi:molybdenum cofactor guanylyltransferase
MKSSLYGLVLAGGRSSRMGTDKAALVHPDGRTLARRCYDLLGETGCNKVMLSLRSDQEIPIGFGEMDDLQIVRDPANVSAGPIVGIVSAMEMQPDASWIVVACDLPRLDQKTLLHLVTSLHFDDSFLAYRSESDGLPEPLCAIYAPAALPIFKQALADNFRCPRKILINHHCRLLDSVTPRALENANSPDDWATAQLP